MFVLAAELHGSARMIEPEVELMQVQGLTEGQDRSKFLDAEDDLSVDISDRAVIVISIKFLNIDVDACVEGLPSDGVAHGGGGRIHTMK